MTKLISRETRDEVLRLRFEENLSFSEIAKRANVGRSKAAELCHEEEVRRKREAEKQVKQDEKSQTAQELEAEAFKRYEQKVTPLDLVTEGFTSSEIAESLWDKFVRLKTISDRPPGYNDGYVAGYKEAKKRYEVGIPCCRCGGIMWIEKGEKIVSDLENLLFEVIKTNLMFVDSGGTKTEWNWHHKKCPEQKG